MPRTPGGIKTAQDIHGVQSPEEWRQRALDFGTRNGTFTELTERGDKPLAWINAGRWVTLCAWCNNAPAVEPDWELAICYECGAEYEPHIPEIGLLEAVEDALVVRPIMARNWEPSESPEVLLAENYVNQRGGS